MSSTGKLLIETPIELRWRDLDALNHDNNASFLTFFEEARRKRRAGPGRSGRWQADRAAGAILVSVTARRTVADDEAGIDAVAVVRIEMDFYRSPR